MALRISDPVNLKWKTKNEYNWGRLRLQRLLCCCSVEKYDTVMATLQTWNKPATFRKFVLEIITIASAVCSKKISESTASSHGPLKIWREKNRILPRNFVLRHLNLYDICLCLLREIFVLFFFLSARENIFSLLCFHCKQSWFFLPSYQFPCFKFAVWFRCIISVINPVSCHLFCISGC